VESEGIGILLTGKLCATRKNELIWFEAFKRGMNVIFA